MADEFVGLKKALEDAKADQEAQDEIKRLLGIKKTDSFDAIFGPEYAEKLRELMQQSATHQALWGQSTFTIPADAQIDLSKLKWDQAQWNSLTVEQPYHQSILPNSSQSAAAAIEAFEALTRKKK